MMHGHMISMALSGQGVVYPGHPLVVATIIMECFESFAEANKTTEHGWCEALSDSRIPGSGCHVGAAMRTLDLGHKDGTVEQMITHASGYWLNGNAGGHHKNVHAGTEQARAFESRFRELAANRQWWDTRS